IQLAYRYLFSDAYNWLKFFWYTNSYKARQLTDALIQAYNTENLLAWVILGRSTLEYAAVSYYFVQKMNQLQLEGQHFCGRHIQRLEDLMVKYAHGTRFNWPDLVAGNMESLKKKFDPSGTSKAVHVNDGFRELVRRDQRYKDVEIAYAMLSD